MYKRQPETADCGYCEGNRQLLDQLLADVRAISEKIENIGSPLAQTLESMQIEVAHLGPDDYIILTTERHLSDDEVSQIEANVAKPLSGRKIIILDGGLKLAVVHPDGGANDADT